MRELDLRRRSARYTDSRLDRLEAMHQAQLAAMNAQLQMMQDHLAASQHKQPSGPASASTPSDDAEKLFIVQRRLIADFGDTSYWWSERLQRKENAHETMLRARIYSYLVKILPGELYRRVPENDVLGIYHNIVRVNCPTHSQQETDLRGRISRSNKGNRPMTQWLDELYDLIEQLEKIDCRVQTATVRTIILASLQADKRYKQSWRKISKHKEWNIAKIRAYLEAEAQLIGDLVENKSSKKYQAKIAKAKEKKKDKRGKKKAAYAKALQDAADSMAEQVRLKAMLAAHQRAHGARTEGKRQPKAEKPPLDAKRRDQLRNELCQYYLIGNCSRGDSCMRKHQTIDQLKRQNDQKRSGGTQPKSFDTKAGPLGMCHQWMANGACTFGDGCKFSHAPPATGKVARYHLN